MPKLLPLVLVLASCSSSPAKRVAEADSGKEETGGVGGNVSRTGGTTGSGGRSAGGTAAGGDTGVGRSTDAGVSGAGGAAIEDAARPRAVDSGHLVSSDASSSEDSGTRAPSDAGHTDAGTLTSGCAPSGATPASCGASKGDPYKYWWGCQGLVTPVPDVSGTKQCLAAAGTPSPGTSAWCCIPACARNTAADATCSLAYPFGWQCVGAAVPNSETPAACTGGGGGVFCCDDSIGKPPPT